MSQAEAALHRTVFPAGAYWYSSWRIWVLFGLILIPVWLIFDDALVNLYIRWMTKEEYSHGILIPFISLFLIWQEKNTLARHDFSGSWTGVGVLVLGLFVYFLGELGTLYILITYAFLVFLLGLVLAIVGREIFRNVWVPLCFLFFAIPLPDFFYRGLSAELQLWSSKLGVQLIRLCDISVYLEGNVIDLGSMQLQVVEACSGLRYLFPLVSLAFMCAYFFKAPLWKRAIVFLSSFPITVLMNSFRIGVIGILVEYWGKSMAEGFLHDFEGWIVFMACTAILVGEMWLLAKIGKDPRPLAEVFGVAFPEPLPNDGALKPRDIPVQYWASAVIILAAFGLSHTLEHRDEIVPERQEYLDFPMALGDWRGRRSVLEQQYIDQLRFDDYVLADYLKPGDRFPVNFYSSYYESERKGESVHSPRSCIPGGGWQIASLETYNPEGLALNGRLLRVNRLLIKKGDDQQLVYYWFQQRGRNITSEYLVKWYILWDALNMNRTDGALVRLTTLAPKGESVEDADRRLAAFLRELLPQLQHYVPN